MSLIKTVVCISLVLAASQAEAAFRRKSAPPLPQKQLNNSVLSEPKRTWSGLFITGDYLWWKASVSGWPYAVSARVRDIPSVITYPEHNTLKDMSFAYQQGWRAGAGIRFDPGWDLAARWTHLHVNNGESLHAEGDQAITTIWTFVFAPGNATRLHAHQFIHYDEVGLNFVKSMFLGTHFLLSPYFGGIGAEIDQGMNIDVDYAEPGSVPYQQVKLRNKFRGAGVQAGCRAGVAPVKWFSLFADASYSLLYGQFHLTQNDLLVIDSGGSLLDLPAHYHEPLHALTSAFNAKGGFRFSFLTSNEKFEFYLEGAYEFVLWPSQIKLHRILTDLEQGYILLGSGDLGFQGATGGFGMRF